jgi:hypothetical protein
MVWITNHVKKGATFSLCSVPNPKDNLNHKKGERNVIQRNQQIKTRNKMLNMNTLT